MAFGYDGSVRIKADLNHSDFDKGLSSMTSKVQTFGNTLKKLAGMVAAAFGTAAIINFGKEAVNAASALNDAWIGLESIVTGQGKSFSKAKSFINEYISDGLVPLQDAVTAYKSLAARGYDSEQIEQTMVALKDAAAFGRQSSYTLGEAVSSAAEGLKNENSILVDNAGVTKNVAKMWEDYAKSIGTTSANLTQEQKIQAEVNGILEETRFQTGDAAKLVNTYSGQIALLGYNFQNLKVQVGNAIMPIVQAVLPGINAIISALTKLATVFAQVTALLFGKSAQVTATNGIASSAGAAAEATDSLAAATEGAGDASESAAKQMKGVLAGFDELNILADNTASSLNGAAGGIDMGDMGIKLPEVETEGELFSDVEISPKLLAEIEALKDALSRIWEVFKKSWEENGPAVIEAGKRALNSLYELAKSIGTAFTEAWTGGAGEEFLNAVLALAATVLNIIADIADAWKTAFDNVGTEFFESVLFRLTAILELINSIGEAFREVWNNGTGVEICETILRILTDINNIFGTIYTKIQEAWAANENGVAIWQAVLDVVQTVLSFIEKLLAATLEWAQGLNLEPLMSAFRGLVEAINPLVEVITDGLAYAYENVLLPLGEWILEELAPIGIELVTAAIEALTTVLEVLEPLAEWLWENFLQPLAEWTGDIIIDALKSITDALNDFSTWVSENKSLIEDWAITIGSFAAAFVLVNGAISVWNTVSAIAAAATTAFGAAFAFLTSPIGLVVTAIAAVIAIVVTLARHWDEVKEAAEAAVQGIKDFWGPIGSWIDENIIQPVAEFWSGLFDDIAEGADQAVRAIQDFYEGLPGWFDENIIQPVAKFWGDLFDDIAQWASDTWDNIVQAFKDAGSWFEEHVTGPIGEAFEAAAEFVKGVINGIIGTVEGMVNAVIKAINWVITQINKLHIDIPDNPLTGPLTIGFNIQPLSEVQLPRLANGAVIPPNQQFAAILGDQRSGMNIEAPLKTIEQAVRNVMGESGFGGEINITVESVLDGKVVAQNTVKHIKRMTRSSGKSPLYA